MQSFRYRTYGLNIESEIECPNLQAFEGEPDVRVRYGAVPERLESPLHDFPWYQSTETEFLLTLPGIGRFWVARGEEIRVQREDQAPLDQLQAYTFGSIFGVVLHQRRILPIHASAIATSKGAVLFAAPSGHGKSTLAGEFARRGYPVLADDVCAVTTLGGVSHIHPARPAILLNPDSLERLDRTQEGMTQAPHNPAKRVAPVAGTPSLEPMKVRAIYTLNPTDRPDIQITPMSGFDKLMVLAANVYRVYLLSGTDALATFFNQLTTLAQSASVFRVERPNQLFLLSQLADQIEEDLNEGHPNEGDD